MAAALEAEVRAANEAFYRAFRDRDVDAMERLWAAEAPVACMHPGMGVVSGRAEVLASWRGILRHPGAPSLSCSDVLVHLLGTTAFVTCLEGQEGKRARLIATNVFVREDGRWRLVHHHGAPLAPSAIPDQPPEEDEIDPSEWN
ncbi:MAG: DUF4440 domain-containing protein [Sandaracinus sp.]|nr:DUF4440 domain-containing protein [Sandaracinus sp.]|tara:strand:+ start:34 stop:465 length:432 start_codon:yes stop_codon:yes gene_type:complete